MRWVCPQNRRKVIVAGLNGHLPQHNPKPPKKQLSNLECMGNNEGSGRKGVSLWEWKVDDKNYLVYLKQLL